MYLPSAGLRDKPVAGLRRAYPNGKRNPNGKHYPYSNRGPNELQVNLEGIYPVLIGKPRDASDILYPDSDNFFSDGPDAPAQTQPPEFLTEKGLYRFERMWHI